MAVRELAPLDLHLDVEAPSGRHTRWGRDEPNAENIPQGLTFGDTMPGGFDTCDLTLPRRPDIVYPDLELLSKGRVLDAGGNCQFEGRLERTPRTSDSSRSVSPSFTGYQGSLEDDDSAVEVYADTSLNDWGEDKAARKLFLLTAGLTVDKAYTVSTGGGQIIFNGSSGGTIPVNSVTELCYIAPAGVEISKIQYTGTEAHTTNVATTQTLQAADSEDITTGLITMNLTMDGTLRTQAFSDSKRYVILQTLGTATHVPAAGSGLSRSFSRMCAYGNSGVPTYDPSTSGYAQGVLASDVIGNAVSRWAPQVSFTTGANGSLTPSTFVIQQMAFTDRTTVADIITQANRFELRDWAIWEGPTFYYHDRGARGRAWRARIRPSALTETGRQIDRLWNGILVRYQDVDGTSLLVGPTGSGADTESADLLDTDSENPANQLGIRRWDLLDLNGVSTAAGATRVGQRFLEEAQLLDSSGQATFTGYVEDDRGVKRPYSQVRSGDTVSFIDASDTSARRVVRTSKDTASRSCTVDLDAPPEGLDALLERLQVVLTPLGF